MNWKRIMVITVILLLTLLIAIFTFQTRDNPELFEDENTAEVRPCFKERSDYKTQVLLGCGENSAYSL